LVELLNLKRVASISLIQIGQPTELWSNCLASAYKGGQDMSSAALETMGAIRNRDTYWVVVSPPNGAPQANKSAFGTIDSL
jgi:hypothetical protein